ncbi:MAG: arginine--tRNA ligase, partial [Solirubrobacteraceae bacterium]
MNTPLLSDPVSRLRTTVLEVVAEIAGGHQDAVSSTPKLMRPKRAGQGDYATNAAMLLAPVLGQPPREMAAQLGQALAGALGHALVGHEIAGPGFLNLVLSDSWHIAALRHVLD